MNELHICHMEVEETIQMLRNYCTENFSKKMFESRSEDALVLLVKLVKSTVMTVETVETVETVKTE